MLGIPPSRTIEQPEQLPEAIEGYSCGALFRCSALARDAFGERANEPALSHMAYLYRRFGPPFYGSDEHKAIACWILTTGTPDLWFWVSCKASALRHCFGVMLTYALSAELDCEPPDGPRVIACRLELVECYRELLRPVFVRDIPINLLGRCDPSPDALVVEPSRYAGYPCDRGSMDALVAADKETDCG